MRHPTFLPGGAAPLLLTFALAACDATIHEYPRPERATVVVSLNVDRRPPVYYKEVTFEGDGKTTVAELDATPAPAYAPPAGQALRIVVEIYGAGAGNLPGRLVERRVLYAAADAQPPQDTICTSLPDGDYRVLAWADYVPAERPDGGCYVADALTDVAGRIDDYPADMHRRSSAAGQAAFRIDFDLDADGYPLRSDADAAGAERSRTVPVMLGRPSGRYRVLPTDAEAFARDGRSGKDLRVEVVYRQYVGTGFNVATSLPNRFVSTYSFEAFPDSRDLSFGDYLFTSEGHETVVLADFSFYDAEGTPLSRCRGVSIPLYRNGETVVRGPFLTHGAGTDGDVRIDENFNGEFVVPLARRAVLSGLSGKAAP